MYKSIGFKGKHILFTVFILLLLTILVRCMITKANDEQNAATPADVVRFLQGFGWELDEIPVSVKNVQIPAEFSEVYEEYNSLQKKQGYDLSKHRTDYASNYCFKVTNHQSGGEVFANVLVIDGKVVGGDICSYSLSGFMTGFDGKTV